MELSLIITLILIPVILIGFFQLMVYSMNRKANNKIRIQQEKERNLINISEYETPKGLTSEQLRFIETSICWGLLRYSFKH